MNRTEPRRTWRGYVWGLTWRWQLRAYAGACSCPTCEGRDPQGAAMMRWLIATERRIAEFRGREYRGKSCPKAIDTPMSLNDAAQVLIDTAGDADEFDWSVPR